MVFLEILASVNYRRVFSQTVTYFARFVPVSYDQYLLHCLLLSLYYYYSIVKLVYNILTAVQPYLIFLYSVHMCGILNLNPQLEFFIPSIASFTARSGFVHSVFSYSIFGIPNRSAPDCVRCSKISYKFPLLCWKLLLLCWHYAFQPQNYADIIDLSLDMMINNTSVMTALLEYYSQALTVLLLECIEIYQFSKPD